jgi:hypothetical protein
MAAENDRFTATREGHDQVFDFAAADGVKAGGRFVEDACDVVFRENRELLALLAK